MKDSFKRFWLGEYEYLTDDYTTGTDPKTTQDLLDIEYRLDFKRDFQTVLGEVLYKLMDKNPGLKEKIEQVKAERTSK